MNRDNAPGRSPIATKAASELTNVAADCHRAKWAYDTSERRLAASEAKHLVARAFDDLHRIGNAAIKAREYFYKLQGEAAQAPTPSNEALAMELYSIFANEADGFIDAKETTKRAAAIIARARQAPFIRGEVDPSKADFTPGVIQFALAQEIINILDDGFTRIYQTQKQRTLKVIVLIKAWYDRECK